MSMHLGCSKAPKRRRGGALLIALLLMLSVAGLSLAVLRVSSGSTQLMNASVDGKKAFYIAEAGLAESYNGLVVGNTGQIGSLEAPALYAGGLVWVDTTERVDGRIELRSTGLFGSGRDTLELVVEPVELLLGIFSDQDLVVDAPLLLDGFDSEEGTYHEQLGGGTVTPGLGDEWKYNSPIQVLYVNGTLYDVRAVEGETYTYAATLAYDEAVLLAQGTSTTITSADGLTMSVNQDPWSVAREYFDQLYAESTAASGGTGVASVLGPTTGGGGVLASNGSIVLGSTELVTIELFGDAVPGPEGTLTTGSNVLVTGNTTPNADLVELAPVLVPDVELLPGLNQTSATPLVIPSSTIGYDTLVVQAGAELQVIGPATLVVGTLDLRAGAMLILDNTAGPVDLVVLDSALLATGASVLVAGRDPGDLSLQVAGTGAVDLHASSQFYGLVYAPDAAVSVEEPFELFGAMVGGSIALGADVRLHFDSGFLARNALPRLISWRIEEIPAAVAQTRIDPFVLLNLDKTALLSINDSQGTKSYWLLCNYLDKNWEPQSYAGPLEDFRYTEAWEIQTFAIEPPSKTASGTWTIDIDYKVGNTGMIVYQGSVSQFSPSTVSWIRSMSVTLQ